VTTECYSYFDPKQHDIKSQSDKM